jgi:CHAT domain-containing protein
MVLKRAFGVVLGWLLLAGTAGAIAPRTIEGELTAGDPKLDDGTHYDVYEFQGRAGEEVAIELESEEFDAYLMLNHNGDRVGEDDDSGGQLNSLMVVELPTDGTYRVIANTVKAGEQGRYRLTWRNATQRDRQRSEAFGLNQLAVQLYGRSQWREALPLLQQANALYRSAGDRAGEGTTLNNIGGVYQLQGQYGLALEQFQQALEILREVGDRAGEGTTLNNIGTVYRSQGQYGLALEQFQQALAIRREVGDRAGEGTTLNNIGYAIEETVGSAAAIPFFKNAVEVYETIRADQRTTPLEHQQSYTETVAGTYRKLADLLIAQGRIPEAERVLDLLALQEIASYTQGSRATVDELGRLEYTATETAILQQHNSIIEFGQKLQRCDVAASTTQDCQTLRRQYAQLQEEFRRVVATVMQDAIRPDDSNPQNPADLRSGAQALLEQQERTIVIQTILRRPSETDDNRGRLVLLWTVPGEVANYREVILPDTFSRTVFEFRQAINRQRDPDPAKTRQLAQQLYNWIVRPLQDELDRNQIEHLIFRLDRELRYLPIAALHDGNQYLIERYSVANFITLGDIDPTARLGPRDTSNILALGRTEAYANFPALPHVKTELDAIVQEAQRPDPNGGLFRGSSYLDRDFTADRLSLLTGRNILHVATHGEFNPTNTVNSYFLLGTGGDKFDLDAIENMRGLGDIHLAVLSACETGLSGDPENLARRGANGFEINSLAYAFTRLGRAKAVIASLWRVNDRSTSILMQDFYQRLAANPALTKATALQQSQIAFLRGELTQPNDLDPDADPSHPYHWAPFVLTGNSW